MMYIFLFECSLSYSSVLNFTLELDKSHNLIFLDLTIESVDNKLIT